MGNCCMAQETQTGALYQSRGVVWWGRWEAGSKVRGYMQTYYSHAEFMEDSSESLTSPYAGLIQRPPQVIIMLHIAQPRKVLCTSSLHEQCQSGQGTIHIMASWQKTSLGTTFYIAVKFLSLLALYLDHCTQDLAMDLEIVHPVCLNMDHTPLSRSLTLFSLYLHQDEVPW